MRTLSELQKRILKTEFPDMNFESDTDIERYFELRSIGRQADALDLYNSRLRRKYPNDEQRTLLMRYYRSHDERYREILRDNMVSLAERAVTRTTNIITVLTKDIDSVNMTDAYSVIKLAEGILSIISPDRYIAISFTEKYVRYAKIMDYRFTQMERTAELIRLYVTETLESVQELKKEHTERRKQRDRLHNLQKRTTPGFDLSKIIFTPEDVAKIILPKTISRTEDIVIAYCIRYWKMVNDTAFERTIFLYSRKYKTHHSDIFLAIKNGVIHGWKDEEILNSVLANVVTGYYYNISGDLYLQRTWARYKQSSQIPGTPEPLGLPSLSPAVTVIHARKTRKSAKRVQRKKSIQTKPKKAITPVALFIPPKNISKKKKPVLPRAPVFIPNSISDMIRKQTGKTYTVYKELFFRGIRPSIRIVLAASLTKKGSLFGNKQNEAEEIIHKFLYEHYNDPYQNWKDSEERKKVEELGYSMPELEPIIAGWIKENG